jgi:hypothetical protein
VDLDVGVLGEKFGRGPNVCDDVVHHENAAILVNFSVGIDGDYNGVRVKNGRSHIQSCSVSLSQVRLFCLGTEIYRFESRSNTLTR